MFGSIVALVGVLVVAVGVLAAGFVLGMRSKSPLVRLLGTDQCLRLRRVRTLDALQAA